ncbi:hypothetical protein DBV05_g5444 [Lasiodiplodia theobromae]|uniref:NmrA-like domain-containing protein n=1 Tax=Lasiodiplodia theobromae TaxID=45133 RepID=A0A5N5DFX3_9PEZI|nr:hypothetical protein DBV05_g5444 [Lasiodiplodia theobromae]
MLQLSAYDINPINPFLPPKSTSLTPLQQGAGDLGPHIISALLETGIFTVTVISRPTSTSTFAPGVTVRRSDFTTPSLLDAFRGQHAVIDVRARPDVPAWTATASAAAAAGVRRFIPSDFVLDIDNAACGDLYPENRQRCAIRAYLKELADKNPGFSWTAVTNGPFLDWRDAHKGVDGQGLRTGFLGFDLATASATIYDSGDATFCATTLPDVGKAVASILLHKKETANTSVHISSVTTSQNELLRVLVAKTRKEWTVKERIDTEESLRRGKSRQAAGDFSRETIYASAMAAIFNPVYGSDFSKAAEGWNKLLGLERRGIEELVRESVEGKV